MHIYIFFLIFLIDENYNISTILKKSEILQLQLIFCTYQYSSHLEAL